MVEFIMLAAAVIIICLALTRLTNKLGLPTLIVFIGLGMFFGTDGVVKIPFEDYSFAEQICSVSLIFIMFYGGFGTNWKRAKSTAPIAVLLSTLGVVLTAVLVGVFCHLAMGMPWLESLLLGSVIGSTDAASVFSILRSKRLNLKYNTASLLEVESGSNDPCAYMMTVIVLTLLSGQASGGTMVWMILAQLIFGVGVGVLTALLAKWMLERIRMGGDGYESIFVFGMALLSYAGATLLGGNGYLSVYITGIMLGNMPIPGKKQLVHFFDGITGLMQILIFFLLGLLSFPSQLPQVAGAGLLVALFLTFIARPVAVSLVMTPFRCPFRQQLLVSWAGLRGAASIVFAIMATVHPAATDSNLFNIVFFIVLFSIAIQGTLIPLFARKLDMIDDSADVMKTFSDYSEETPVQFIRLQVGHNHPWAHKQVFNIRMMPELRMALVIRKGKQIVPRGHTRIYPGDTVVVSGPSLEGDVWGTLTEQPITRDHDWCGKALNAIHMPRNTLVVMIKRGRRTLIPNGDTVLREGDVLVVNQS